ncbi:MAG: DUF4363 family protein [Clostridia bacterium]|nr:DUF4363 family protein [Clostridia bacterium]
MKNMIISSAILLTIVILLCINSVVLDRCADSLLQKADAMSDDPLLEIENARSLEKEWEAIEPFVSITVVHLETEAVTNSVSLISVYASTNNQSEFIAAKNIFKHAVSHISFSGKLSHETIL